MSDDWQVVEEALLADSDSQAAFDSLARLREREAQIERKYRATVDWGDKALMAACEKERTRAEAAEARVAELQALLDKHHMIYLYRAWGQKCMYCFEPLFNPPEDDPSWGAALEQK